MKKLTLLNAIILVITLALWAVPHTQAGEEYRAPFQVNLETSSRLYMFDCYPYSDYDPPTPLHVYTEYPTGVAVYSCFSVGSAVGHYIPQSREDLAFYTGDN